MIRTLQDEFADLKRDILELKTAQAKPSIITANYAKGIVLPGIYDYGTWTWTITYELAEFAPITKKSGYWPTEAYFRPYSNNQQKLVWSGETTLNDPEEFYIVSTRKIISITQDQIPPRYEWQQVRDFYPQDMGRTKGWCLQNSRLGFHIYSGTYPNAKSDMLAQQASGTLHAGTPPDYIAVPIYFANYSYTPDGHIAVWDHGTVYSDGDIYPSISSVASDYMGWGESCDGQRVVQRI